MLLRMATAAAVSKAASLCFTLKVGQYNMLAASLASNLKPWYWYGCQGIVPGQPYMGDAFDARRVATFGYGRSRKLIELWSVAKTYLRLFDTEEGFPYRVADRVSRWQVREWCSGLG